MRDVSCKLLKITTESNEIGVEEESVTEKEVPISKVEEIYANEFYEANEQGYKPSLRLRLSALNYDNEQELIYMNIRYSIIRVSEPYPDEVILVCERKVRNVKNN